MKEWVRLHPYLALAVAYALLFVFITAAWMAVGRRGLGDSFTTGFVLTLSYWLLAIFGIRRSRKAKGRLEESGQMIVYIRYPDSRPGSLSSIWNQGIVTPSAGTIHFQPAVYDTLEPSGRATTIKVQDLLPERRTVSGKDRKYIQVYGIHAMTVLTDEGKVEIAAHPEALDRLSDVPRRQPVGRSRRCASRFMRSKMPHDTRIRASWGILRVADPDARRAKPYMCTCRRRAASEMEPVSEGYTVKVLATSST